LTKLNENFIQHITVGALMLYIWEWLTYLLDKYSSVKQWL